MALICHTFCSICSCYRHVIELAYRWLHSPILELHTFSQCGQNTFGEDFVLRVLLWLKRPMRVTGTVCHTHRECALLSREFSDDFTVQSWSCIPSHSVDRTLLVRTFVLWVLLWLERPMRDRHCFPHTEHLLCRVMSYQMKLQSNLGVCIPSLSVDRTLLVRTLSCGSCCGWRGQCVTGTVCHKPSMQTVMIININVLLVYWTRL